LSIWRRGVRPILEVQPAAAGTFGLPLLSRGGKQMQKITPCLWFDGKAEEAMKFYMSIFKNAKVVNVMHCGEAGPGPKGSVLAVPVELEGRELLGRKGGPHYSFTPAISLLVKCATRAGVDVYWEKLLAGGGKPMQCGWLTDKYGVSWQIVPTVFGELLQSKDAEKSQRAMKAMMQMVKLDIASLKKDDEGRRQAAARGCDVDHRGFSGASVMFAAFRRASRAAIARPALAGDGQFVQRRMQGMSAIGRVLGARLRPAGVLLKEEIP